MISNLFGSLAARSRVAPLLLAIVLVVGITAGASTVAAYPLSPSETAVEDALDFLRSEQESDGSVVDFGTTCRVVCAVVAADEDPSDWDYAGTSLVDYLEAEAGSASSAMDYSLAIMAAVAAGEDPTSFGGVDLVDLLEGEYNSGQIGNPAYLNDDFWGLMALVAADDEASSTIVSNVRDFIVSNQSSDPADYGSWSWGVGEDGDVDDTAAAIMALMATGTSTSSSVITDGLDYLADNQDTSGGFLSWGSTNADTNSWAILSIVAANENPDSSAWDVDGNTPVDDLLSFQQPSGEFYWQSGDPGWNVPMTTSSAIQALVGVPWPVPGMPQSSDDAELAVSLEEMAFGATEDGDDPLDRVLEVWNEGDGTLDWEADTDEDWLDVTPSSGTSTDEHDDVTVSVDISGLSEGTHEATITIDASGADGSPQTIDVTLEIWAEDTDPVVLFVPDEFNFETEEAGDDPDSQVLELWNGGPDEVDWEVESDEDWLTLDPDSGSSTGEHDEVEVSVDTEDLDSGEHEATITVSWDDGDESETIDVTLVIDGDSSSDEPEIDFSPSKLEFEAVEDGENPDDEVLTIWNSGDGTLSFRVSDDVGWLSLSPRSGSSDDEDDEVEVTVSVNISGLADDEYTAEIVIEDDDASNSPEEVKVTLTLEESNEPDFFRVNAQASPAGTGTISSSPMAGGLGYLENSQVVFTAVPARGFAFTGWSGAVTGSENPLTITVTDNMTLTANFFRFDTMGLTNVELASVSPDMTGVIVAPYPVANLPNQPKGTRVLVSYLVEPQGSGSFTLRLTGLPMAASAGVFKLQSGGWTQLPVAYVSESVIEVTMGAVDPVIAVAYPGGNTGILDTVKGVFTGGDSTTLIIIGVVLAVVVLVVLLLVYFNRRSELY